MRDVRAVLDGHNGRVHRAWAGWWRGLVVGRHAPLIVGVGLAVAAVAEAVVHALRGPQAGTQDGPLFLLVFALLGLATTLPLALIRTQTAVAAVVIFAAIVVSLVAFQTLTVAGVGAQLVSGYVLGRTGSQRLAVLVSVPFLVLAPVVALDGASVSSTVPYTGGHRAGVELDDTGLGAGSRGSGAAGLAAVGLGSQGAGAGWRAGALVGASVGTAEPDPRAAGSAEPDPRAAGTAEPDPRAAGTADPGSGAALDPGMARTVSRASGPVVGEPGSGEGRPLVSGDGMRLLMLLLACLAPAAAFAGIAQRARGEARENSAATQVIAGTLLEHTARGERARIARELHDVVAHHISMVAVQAETARLAVPGMPAEGAERLSAIGDTARAALTEMRRLLGVLREDASAAELEPQPGLRLRELNDLLDEAREASGSAVRLILRGVPVVLDPGVELAAHRIVQEALTNARRHAPGAAVDVELHYTGEELHLLIRDNGPGLVESPGSTGRRERVMEGHGVMGRHERVGEVRGSVGVRERAGEGRGPVGMREQATEIAMRERAAEGHAWTGGSERAVEGHGLTGMRERAGAVGGRLRAGVAEGGGFMVEAILPGTTSLP